MVRHVAGHHGSSTDQCAFSDSYSTENDGTAAKRSASLNPRRHHFPVFLGLETVIGRRTRIQIVNKDDAVPDEDIILDRDAFADEGVRRDLATPSNSGVFLHLDECSYLAFVADGATLEVDQFWLKDLDPVP